MPVVETKNFGPIQYRPPAVLEFPAGLPGFEQRRRFLPVHLESSNPLVYLQSLEDPELCFVSLPIGAVDPAYRMDIGDEDVARLGFTPGHRPVAGVDVFLLALVSIKETGPTANLLAPVVINPVSNLAVQAIAPGSDYSWEYPLLPAEPDSAEAASAAEETTCSS